MSRTTRRNGTSGGSGSRTWRPPATEPVTDRDLVRLVHGELDSARAATIRRRMAQEPALAERVAQLEGAWERLDLPPAEPAPPGFAARVAARALEQDRRGVGEEVAAFRPPWVRAVAAAALTVGIGTGVVLGGLAFPSALPSPVSGETGAGTASGAEAADAFAVETVPTLAESYWSVVAPDHEGQEDGAGEEVP